MNLSTSFVLDCDPGIDDALALFLAAGSTELDWLGVTCVAGNRPLATTSRNARALLDMAGRDDVPVFAGAGRPLTGGEARCNIVHGEDGLGGVDVPLGGTVEPGHAVDFLRRLLAERPDHTVTVIAVGPLTNLALAELLVPGLLARASALLIMGGAAFCPGNVTPSAEFNFWADPLAAQVVLRSGARILMFGLDVTRRARMPPDWIASFATLGTASGDASHGMLASYTKFDPLLHDACPVGYLIRQELFSGVDCEVDVDWRPGPTEGLSIVRCRPDETHTGPLLPNATVITDLDAGALLDLVRERVARLP